MLNFATVNLYWRTVQKRHQKEFYMVLIFIGDIIVLSSTNVISNYRPNEIQILNVNKIFRILFLSVVVFHGIEMEKYIF